MRGMERNALRDIETGEPWQKTRAERTLSNIAAAHTAALPQWLNKVLADQKNSKKDFKLLRAHRRGLLHYDQPAGWGYPKNWKEVASRIRQLDGFQCTACAAQDQPIDVHHIVYVSNFGTHQQTNLISLCRDCHEAEHKRNFDLGESDGEQALSSAEILIGVDRSAQDVQDLEPLQPSLSASIPQQPPRQPILQEPICSMPLTPPAPATSALPTKIEQTITNVSNAAVAQRFCGHCRTLVIPRRRFLLLKQCPNCEHAI